MTYFITFSCYGCHLHGHQAGSVDRTHNIPGSRPLDPNPQRSSAELRHMDQPPYVLDKMRQRVVLQALQHVSAERGWTLLAAHVRTSHVHVVVGADDHPEKVMHAFKSYASRFLNEAKVDDNGRKRWARHGSTRWLWRQENISAAIRYVVDGQGEPMAVFEAAATVPFSRGSVSGASFLRNERAFPGVSLHMPKYALEYAQEHLPDLFHQARLGAEVLIIREDGQLCELTPLAEARNEEPSSKVIEIPKEPEAESGDLIPA